MRAALHPSIPEPVIDVAVLLVSELVTNAVLHARSETEVRVVAAHGCLRVEVDDHNPTPPSPAAAWPDEQKSNGRGLLIVEALAGTFGVHTGPTTKTAWFTLAL